MIRKPIVQINKKTLNNRVDAENDRRHGPCGASPAPSGHFRSRQAFCEKRKKQMNLLCHSGIMSLNL